MSELEKTYSILRERLLVPIARALEAQLLDYLSDTPRIDRVTARAKTVKSFLKKASTMVEGKPKYEEPLRQIQDQIGARIITFYRSDVDRVGELVNKYYRPIESKTLVPDSEWKFGYFGKHFILVMPSDVVDHGNRESAPQFFELQIKTLFQHAWSEANHDLGYKPASLPFDPEAERKLAFTSAQAWGADHMFNELHAGQSG